MSAELDFAYACVPSSGLVPFGVSHVSRLFFLLIAACLLCPPLLSTKIVGPPAFILCFHVIGHYGAYLLLSAGARQLEQPIHRVCARQHDVPDGAKLGLATRI